MNELTFGEKLERVFGRVAKSSRMVGKYPTSVATVTVEGHTLEISRSVAHPWFWKVENKATGKIDLLEDQWDLAYYTV